MRRRTMFDVAPAIAGLIILIITVSISGHSTYGFLFQNSKKVVSTEAFSQPDREPVIISNVKIGDNPINLNKEFDAEDEWIRDLSFKLKNHSHKNVTFVGTELYFPDPYDAGPGMVRQLRFGQRPDLSNASDGVLFLKHGDSLSISLPTQYESLKQFLETKQPVSRLRKMMIRVYLVIFEDGTKWDLGNYYVPDSSKPSGFRMIGPEMKGEVR
ncbi:MAG TPA: hypothetical protein VFS76_22565 [Pyrinomonadaceae bacterium]|nr:hypothetical protein [Pyrinomonadaceae bacterium]